MSKKTVAGQGMTPEGCSILGDITTRAWGKENKEGKRWKRRKEGAPCTGGGLKDLGKQPTTPQTHVRGTAEMKEG